MGKKIRNVKDELAGYSHDLVIRTADIKLSMLDKVNYRICSKYIFHSLIQDYVHNHL